MEYINFGNTGRKVSPLCLGTISYGGYTEQFPWALPEAESRPFIQKALEVGINFFDTADVYNEGNSERVVGKLYGTLPSARTTCWLLRCLTPACPMLPLTAKASRAKVF